jgi:DNA processing protein
MIVNLSKDSLATILICSNLGLTFQSENNLKPYTISQWNKLKEKIAYSSLKRPEALFVTTVSDWKRELYLNDIEIERLQRLLSRAGQVGIEIEQLESKGIFITTRAESTYPERLKQTLKKVAPPVLFYCGNLKLLNSKAVAIVGSREIDEAAIDFTIKLAKKCVINQLNIVSGGAKGVDSLSQAAAIEAGGEVVAVLSDGLANKIKAKEIREAIIQGKLLLFSAVHPSARFTVFSAMERNKYIYALSDFAVVVSSSDNKGGTWAGATEDLKNKWTPLFVRKDSAAPKGNEKLIKLGAKPIEPEILNDKQIELLDWFNQNSLHSKPTVSEYSQLSLESYISEESEPLVFDSNGVDLYDVCWTYLAKELSEPRTNEELSKILHLQENQLNIWLQRALTEGRVKKIDDSNRYVLVYK